MATIAWQAVDDRGIALEPIYRFRLASSAADDAKSSARLNLFGAASRFLLTTNAALESGLDRVADDPAKTLATLSDTTKSAYADLRTTMADASSAMTDANDQKIASDLSDTGKHLFDLTRNAVDAQKLVMERDLAKDDQGKNVFRAQLQAAIFNTCTAVCSMDDQLAIAAKGWNLTPDHGQPISIAGVTTSNTRSPAAPSASPSLMPLHSTWTETSENTFNHGQRQHEQEVVHAEVVGVDGPDVTLRVRGVKVEHDWKLHVADDGAVRCTQVEKVPGSPGNFIGEVQMNGTVSNGLLTLRGSVTLNPGRNGVTIPTTVLALRIEPHTAVAAAAAGAAAANAPSGTIDAFSADTLRNVQVNADGTMGVKQLENLAFDHTDGREFVVTGEAYFSSAAAAADPAPARKGFRFYFRGTGRTSYEVTHTDISARNSPVGGQMINGVKVLQTVDVPTDTWVPFRIEVRAAQITIQLADKSGTIAGPIRTNGMSGVALWPGSKLRNVKVAF